MLPRPVLVVSECFGPTLQGEGPSVGRPAVFLRLGGCNLKCVWCDTPYTWDWTRFNPRDELHPIPLDQVYDQLCKHAPKEGDPVLVVTGGEPLLQQKNLFKLLYTVRQLTPWQVEVETAGTIVPSPDLIRYVDCFNVSPKLSNSGNPPSKRRNDEAMKLFGKLSARLGACFKFVCEDAHDLDAVDNLVRAYNLWRVYIMAQGIEAGALHTRQQQLVAAVIERGYNLSPRLHVELFGNRRGV